MGSVCSFARLFVGQITQKVMDFHERLIKNSSQAQLQQVIRFWEGSSFGSGSRKQHIGGGLLCSCYLKGIYLFISVTLNRSGETDGKRTTTELNKPAPTQTDDSASVNLSLIRLHYSNSIKSPLWNFKLSVCRVDFQVCGPSEAKSLMGSHGRLNTELHTDSHQFVW